MKKLLIGAMVIASTSLVGCGAVQNDITHMASAVRSGNWVVTVWSGGQAVKVYEVYNGFISTEKESDGWYFNHNGKLVRVTGTVTIEEL